MKAPPEGRRRGAPVLRLDRHGLRLSALLMLALLVPSVSAAAPDARLQFRLQLTAGQTSAEARIRVSQSSGALRELTLQDRESALAVVKAAGDLKQDGDRLVWRPPAKGGELRYQVILDRRRSNGARDGLVASRYAIFRGEDAFPVRSVRRERGAELTSDVLVSGPRGWSVVHPYRPDSRGNFPIANVGVKTVRPLGWFIAGDIGTRREFIDGLELTVSAPRGQRMERLAMIAVLRWTLPDLLKSFPDAPPYVSIVSAGDPFWLGALSAPNSIFVHSDRPLISENGTSTIVHEMVHVLLTPMDTVREEDWIDEGLAEYLSLRALARSGTISSTRFEKTLEFFREWGAPVATLKTAASTGPVTARAVTIFHALDEELRGDQHDLTDVIAVLLKRDRPVDVKALRNAAEKILGRPARSLAPARLPGL